jgi:hypothetical protein
MATAKSEAPAGDGAAFRAVELVYLSGRSSRKVGARHLAVSRATLYRLTKRGIHGLAEVLSRPGS